jgi:hypothetical protein
MQIDLEKLLKIMNIIDIKRNEQEENERKKK